MIEAITLAFITSALLNERTHRAGFPELARYAIGGLLILAAYGLLYPDDTEARQRVLVAMSCAGIGVGLSRIGGALV